MTTKNIGRITLLKYSLISVAIFFAIPVIFVLIYHIFSNEPVKVATFFDNLKSDLKGNELFVLIQIIVILLGTWTFGPIAGRLIITRKRNSFFIGWLTIFLLWILLFFSCVLTDGVTYFLKYGENDFLFELIGWVGYGLSLYIVLGAVHGLIFGYFLGNEIHKKGRKSNAL